MKQGPTYSILLGCEEPHIFYFRLSYSTHGHVGVELDRDLEYVLLQYDSFLLGSFPVYEYEFPCCEEPLVSCFTILF